MKMKRLESWGFIEDNFAYLNAEEYLYSSGNSWIVRPLRASDNKSNYYLEAEFSHFSKFTYNQITKELITCQLLKNINLNVAWYSYDSTREERFEKITNISIPNFIDASYMEVSRDGTRVLILCPEPNSSMLIIDIIKDIEGNVKEMKHILTIPMEGREFTRIKFNPKNKNFLFLMGPYDTSWIEIVPNFIDNYTIDDFTDFEQFKAAEEEKMTKRYEIFDFDHAQEEYTDFTWDVYDKIYISTSSDYIQYFDPIKMKYQKDSYEDWLSNRINKLSSPVTAMLLTQRYLLCADKVGSLMFVNMVWSDKDKKDFRSTWGVKYEALTIDKILTFNSLQENDFIVSMKYDQDYRKIWVKTKLNNWYVLYVKGEVITETEDKNDTEEQSKILQFDQEIMCHQGCVLGVRDWGSTSEAVSISVEDRRVIFWEWGKQMATYSHYLPFKPTVFETDPDGSLLFIASTEGAFRIYDITTRSILRLVYIYRFPFDTSTSIDRIVYHPMSKFLIFYKKGDRYWYFLSPTVGKNFAFWGYLHVPTDIIDVSINNVQGEDFSTDPITLASVLVLVKGMLLLYNITHFFSDNAACWQIEEQKNDNVFTKFEIKDEPKARKIDGDLNYIIRNKTSASMQKIWLVGTDKMFRIFPLPTDKLETVKQSKKPIEMPEEIPAHGLDVVKAHMYNDNILISVGKEGSIQIRKDKNLLTSYKTHSFVRGGIIDFCYSIKRQLIYTCGNDGSVVVCGTDETVKLPETNTTIDLACQIVTTLQKVEDVDDHLCGKFTLKVKDEHEKLIINSKKQHQGEWKARLDEIKNAQSKWFLENSKWEPHEQLKENEMIIDPSRITLEQEKNALWIKERTKQLFKEFCEMELQRLKWLDSTYKKQIEYDEDNSVKSNNNIHLVFNSTGERELKTYALTTVTAKYKLQLTYAKQFRWLEMMEKNKRKKNAIDNILIETNISNGQEDYILNRYNVKPTIVEREVVLGNEAEQSSEKGISMIEEKSRSSVNKYRLQKNPYEESLKKGDEGGDNEMKGPEEQIYKDDQQMEFKTIIEIKEPPELEFKELSEISSYALLYSPFELYTNVRIRNQIILIIDVIHELKRNFNAEYVIYIKERNQLKDKFNANKSAIEQIKEIWVDEQIKDYIYAMNVHEENDWIEKVTPSDIKVPRYYSKEEKEKIEIEKKIEEERLKAWQGDTLQMRGLKSMINNKVNVKTNKNDEQELKREPWMNMKREWMTPEQIKVFGEFQQREKEIKAEKEKIKNQNLTKLNFHKSEIKNNQIDLDMKFAKIVRKKLHYDTLIAEQEIYILALVNFWQKRSNIKNTNTEYAKLLEEAQKQQMKINKEYLEFEKNNEKWMKILPEDKPIDKNFLASIFDDARFKVKNEEYLKTLQKDPYYFYEKINLVHKNRFGILPYDEIDLALNNATIKSQAQIRQTMDANKKYYFEYKTKQYQRHWSYLNEENIKSSEKVSELTAQYNSIISNIEKLRLDYSLMIRIKRSQNEVIDDTVLTTASSNNQSKMIDVSRDGNEDEYDENIELDKSRNKYTLGIPVENSEFFNANIIDQLNTKLEEAYEQHLKDQKTDKDHSQMKQYILLKKSLLEMSKLDILFKMKYLKLTRVTKKIQEIVTGREQIDDKQIEKLYEDKKRNLEENTLKRIATLDKKNKEIDADIKKKKSENTSFAFKLEKLKEDVEKTKQIIDLDNGDNGDQDMDNSDEDHQKGKGSKSLEIAEVSKLKSIVKNYYEEIEYLRAELDKLRARTFPSFLQKPDNVIYPDEK